MTSFLVSTQHAFSPDLMFLNPLLSVVLSCVCQCTVMQVTVYSVSLRFLLRSVTQGLLLNRSARAAGLGVPLLIYWMSATTTHRSLLPDLLFTEACSRARSQSYLCALLLPHRSSLVSRGSRVPSASPDAHFHTVLLYSMEGRERLVFLRCSTF